MNINVKVKESILHYLCDDWNNHKRGKAHKENQALFDRESGYPMWCRIDLEMVMEKVVKGIYAAEIDKKETPIKLAYEIYENRIPSQQRVPVCPVCGENMEFRQYNYCPNCGQRLENESEDKE